MHYLSLNGFKLSTVALLIIEETRNQTESSNKSDCWFLMKGQNWSIQGKTSQNRVEKQQTQATCNGGSGSQTQAILLEGEHSHHSGNSVHMFL